MWNTFGKKTHYTLHYYIIVTKKSPIYIVTGAHTYDKSCIRAKNAPDPSIDATARCRVPSIPILCKLHVSNEARRRMRGTFSLMWYLRSMDDTPLTRNACLSRMVKCRMHILYDSIVYGKRATLVPSPAGCGCFTRRATIRITVDITLRVQ